MHITTHTIFNNYTNLISEYAIKQLQ